MQAVVITKPGAAEVLECQSVSTPEPQRGEVRVRVKATAVNRADILQRMGKYPAPADCPPNIPGLEFAGVVDAIGEGFGEFSVGNRVFGLVGGGSYAQYVVVHARTLARIPENVSFVEAAAMPEAFITAYDAMVAQCKLEPGDTVLIHAVGSGVGTAAVQIGRAIGARTIGTTRTQKKLDKVRQLGLGLDEGLVVEGADFADDVMELTGGQGVDVVLELNGGNYVAEDLRCLAMKGRVVVVGLLAGIDTRLDLARVLSRRLQIRGTTLRARPIEEKIAAGRLLARHIAPLLERGVFKPVIDKVFPLDEAAAAHKYVEENENIGKVILEVKD